MPDILNKASNMTDIGIKTQKRLAGEIRDLTKNKMDFAQAVQDDQNPLVFYFMLKPKDKPYIGGLYLGKIVLPKDYPENPGEFYTLTPNGRFEINKKICLTNSNFHKESWMPTWSIRNMILGFISIFIADDTSGLSHIKEDFDTRLFKAKNSHSYNISNYKDIVLKFDQFIKPDGTPRTDDEVNEYIKSLGNTKKTSVLVDEQPLVANNEPLVANNEPLVANNEPLVANNESLVVNNEPMAVNNEPTQNVLSTVDKTIENVVLEVSTDNKEEVLLKTNMENFEKTLELKIEEAPIKIVKKVDVQKEVAGVSLKETSVRELINRLSTMDLMTYDPEIVLLIESKLKHNESSFQQRSMCVETKKMQKQSLLKKSPKKTKTYKPTDYVNILSKMTIDNYDRTLVDLILKNK
jgi:ubiquitin-protein ligase